MYVVKNEHCWHVLLTKIKAVFIYASNEVVFIVHGYHCLSVKFRTSLQSPAALWVVVLILRGFDVQSIRQVTKQLRLAHCLHVGVCIIELVLHRFWTRNVRFFSYDLHLRFANAAEVIVQVRHQLKVYTPVRRCVMSLVLTIARRSCLHDAYSSIVDRSFILVSSLRIQANLAVEYMRLIKNLELSLVDVWEVLLVVFAFVAVHV